MPLKPRQALVAAVDLVRDPLNYNAAMRFGDALADWPVMRWLYRRMMDGLGPAEVEHLRALTDRPIDFDALAKLPPNTFGWAYQRFMQSQNLSAAAQIDSYPPIKAALARDWVLRRFTRGHDL